MTVIISVSLKPEHKKFLEESHQSASRMLQDAIDFMMYKDTEFKNLKPALDSLREKVRRLHAFLGQRDLAEQYMHFAQENF